MTTYYMTAVFNIEGDVDVGKFWASQETAGRYPGISKVAVQILSIPASTAEAERSFSRLRYVVQERREKMLASAVNNSLVTGSLLRLEDKL